MNSNNLKDKPVIIIGCGGHARSIADAVYAMGGVRILGCVDPGLDPGVPFYQDLRVLGSEEIVGRHGSDEICLVNGVGSVERPTRRRDIFRRFSAYRFLTVFHPFSRWSPTAKCGQGVQVLAGAIINSGASLGDNVICNTGSIIEHDCCIQDHVHVAPGAILGGEVVVGECSHIGAGAVVRQGIRVGREVLVGAGSVVVRDIPDGKAFISGKLVDGR